MKRYILRKWNRDYRKIFYNYIFFLLSIMIFIFSISFIPAALTDNLVACYRLDATSGEVVDSHDNYPGTNGGATRGVTGIINNAFDFENDEGDFVNLTDMKELSGVDEFSVSVWVKPEVMVTTDIVVAQSTAAQGDSSFFIRLFNTGLVDFVIWNEARSLSQINNIKVVAGEWSHIVATYNGTTTKLYVNNSLSASGTLTGNVFNSPQNVTLGSMNNRANFYDGVMDEVLIWNRSLSASEVSDLYNSGNALTCPFTTDSCTYSGSGDFIVDCNDNCTISSDVVGDEGNFSCIGSGTFIMDANISNFSLYHIGGACTVTCRGNEGCFKL